MVTFHPFKPLSIQQMFAVLLLGLWEESMKKTIWDRLQSMLKQGEYVLRVFLSIIYGMPARVLSHVRLFATPWTQNQGPLSVEFPRQEYWSGLPFPSPGGFPNPGIKPPSPALAGGFLTAEPPGNPKCIRQEDKA